MFKAICIFYRWYIKHAIAWCKCITVCFLYKIPTHFCAAAAFIGVFQPLEMAIINIHFQNINNNWEHRLFGFVKSHSVSSSVFY